MQTAEVVIVGGGIVGASIAWHLTESRLPQRAHRGARIASGQRIHRQEHGRRARAVRHHAQHSDVAVLHSLLCRIRGAAGTSFRISRAGLSVRRHQAGASGVFADQPGTAKIAGADASAHVDARGDRQHRSATARRRYPGRQLLPDRWLRRSLQRDGRLHHPRLRTRRDSVALDRGHGDPSRWRRNHRRRNHARPGEHARSWSMLPGRGLPRLRRLPE